MGKVPEGLDPPEMGCGALSCWSTWAPGERVLDVGCGEGHLAAGLAHAGAEVVGIDVADEPLRRARVRYPELDLRMVAPEEPGRWQDASFDAVWAGEMIEHVTDTGAWLSEVRRVLRSGGTSCC